MPGHRKILFRFVRFPPFPMRVDGANARAVIEFLPNPCPPAAGYLGIFPIEDREDGTREICRREAIMGRHLIVDGYNLARSGAVFLPEDPAGPEGRKGLCALLSGYAREKGFRLAVVFDARGAGTPERTRQAFKGGTVVFSSRSETADDVIRDLSRGAPAGTVVVTSDRGLRGTLRTRDVAVVSCEEFADRLADHRGGGGEGPVDEGDVPGEVDDEQEENDEDERRDRGEEQDDPQRGGHSLSSAKIQVHGKHVTQEHGCPHEGEPKVRAVLDEHLHEGHGEDRLPRIQEQGQNSRRLPDGARHVRRPDVPRTHRPEIDAPVEQVGHQDPEGDRSQEIRERDEREAANPGGVHQCPGDSPLPAGNMPSSARIMAFSLAARGLRGVTSPPSPPRAFGPRRIRTPPVPRLRRRPCASPCSGGTVPVPPPRRTC